MYRQNLFIVAVLLLAGAGQVFGAGTKLSYEDLLANLTDLERLPVIEPGVRCDQASSYDRASKYDEANDKYINWDANGDAGQYISIDPQTKEGLMADLKGPGCIFRIWSANPKGIIRFYLDGDTKPTYEWDFMSMFRGKINPFITPLVWTRNPDDKNSGSDCYVPIPYAKSCKITVIHTPKDGGVAPNDLYYHVDYCTYPKDWHLDTFHLPFTDVQEKALKEAADKWAHPGPKAKAEATTIEIKPGETVTVADLKGPGIITALQAKLQSKEKWATRKVLIKAYWDGQENPSIYCPIGDFFGEPKDVTYHSYPVGITDKLNYSLWPMPFHKSAKIVLVNEGKQPAHVTVSVTHEKKKVPKDWGLFHAKWRGEQASTTFDYPFVEATGTGKFVGVCLFPDNIHGGWWGEGDEKVFVDGEKFPSWFGTGSEDYFGDAWGIRYFENPSHGHPQREVERMQGCYRWHLGDSIPFYKTFKMSIENYAGLPGERTKNDYSSVAYWYQLPGGSDFFKETPVEQRIPRGFVVADAVEAEKLLKTKESANVAIVDDENLPKELSNARGVKLTGKVGDEFEFTLTAKLQDRYIIHIGAAREIKASQYDLLVDGKKVEKYAQLKQGDNTVTLKFTGAPVDGDRCELIVDYFKVEPYRNFITEWLVAGPFNDPDAKGLDIEYAPETKVDPKAGYEGRGGKEIKWQKFSNPTGIINLSDLFHPKENLVAYGAVVVNSPEERTHTLLLGSDDGVKVWINGKQVWRNLVTRGINPDEDRVEVTLKKGPNLLLIKIVQEEGRLGWAVRLQDPEEKLTYSLPE